MYDKAKNRITFPHVIPSPVLGGVKYDQNIINGGSKKIADLNIETNTFWGGNCVVVGMIKEFGFYGCPNRYGNHLMGFYVHSGDTVTEKGKKLLAERFPGIEIVYEKQAPASEMTEEEKKHFSELKRQALEVGIAANLITYTNAEDLAGLIKSVASGKNESAAVEVEEPVFEPTADDFTHLSRDGEERQYKRARVRNS